MSRCKAKTLSGKRCKNSAQEGGENCYVHQPSEKGYDVGSSELNAKQERFCQLYVSKEFFANGTQSYMEAYDLNQDQYESARRMASQLLTNIDICNRINELLDNAGLNDEFVDKQLLFLITQNADLSQKNAAIREYNKLKARITERIEDVTPQPKRLVLMEVKSSDGTSS